MDNKANISSLRYTRVAVSAFFFFQGLCFSNWATRIPDVKTNLGLDDAEWGTVLLMMPIGQVSAMGITTPLITKFGSKSISLIGFLLFAITFVTVSLARDQYSLMVILVLLGLFANLCNLAVNTQAVNLEKLYEKPIMSSIHGSWSIANVVGALVGMLFINIRLSTLQHFVSVASVSLLLILFFTKFLLPKLIDKKIHEQKIAKDKIAKKRPEHFLYLLGIIGFCGLAMEATMVDWGAIYFKSVVEAPENLYSLGFTAFVITMAIGRFVSDKVVEKWGERSFFIMCGLIVIVGALLTFVSPSLITSTLAFMIIGFGIAGISPVVFSVAARKTMVSAQLALTLMFGLSFSGFLLIPPFIGYLSYILDLRTAFTLFIVLGICVVTLASVLRILKKEIR
ncbi:MAG: MFS transporter [Dysgonomonas sp.]|nr:MFS transporter [Dysgonomonas sp.]